MRPLTFTLRRRPEQRLDLSPLLPELLEKRKIAEIARIRIGTTKHEMSAADVFDIAEGERSTIVFEGGSDRFDRAGHAMSRGTIEVRGGAGSEAGRLMAGGTLIVGEDTGPWTGSCMTGGKIAVGRDAGDWLGGPLAGELAGMRGGIIQVSGNAGREAGHRMRRGLIAIDGDAGDYAGRAMIAGTLAIRGRAGLEPGYLMRRGTIFIGRKGADLPETFVSCGPCATVFQRLALRAMVAAGARSRTPFNKPLHRHAGDTAVMGKGEIFTAY